MFERLIDLILQAGERILPCFVVRVDEHCGVLRFGKYSRTVGPGLHWKIPFAEDAMQITTAMTTMRLPPQTLTTADGKAVVVAAVVKYKIDNVEPYISLVADQHDALADVTMGSIRALVRERTFDELTTEPPEGKIAAAVRRQVKQFGFDVQAVTFTDLAAVRSFRLIQASPKDLDN